MFYFYEPVIVANHLMAQQSTKSSRYVCAYSLKTLGSIASDFFAFLLLGKKIIVICQWSFAELLLLLPLLFRSTMCRV